MKWYMAPAQGGAQRFMDVNAQESAYNAEQALRDLEIAKNAEASNKKIV